MSETDFKLGNTVCLNCKKLALELYEMRNRAHIAEAELWFLNNPKVPDNTSLTGEQR